MSRRKNGTLRAGAQLGLNPYGWGNGAMQAMKKARRRQPVRATRKNKSISF